MIEWASHWAMRLSIAIILSLSYSVKSIACNISPVYAFTQAVYYEKYDEASAVLARVRAERGPEMAQFLGYVLAWKQAYDRENNEAQNVSLDQIGALIESLSEKVAGEPTIENRLFAGNVMIHAARMYLVSADVFQAAKLAKQGNTLIQSVLDEAPENVDAYLAAGLYQTFAGADEPIFGWFKKLFSLEGDPERGRQLIELAAQLSPDFAFEAVRSLVMDLSWNRPEVCRYTSMFDSVPVQSKALFDHNKLQINLQLYCGQSDKAGIQIDYLNKLSKQNTLEQAQKDWIIEAKLYALAHLGATEALENHVQRYAENAAERPLALARFSLAKAYNIKGEHAKARPLYEKVIASAIEGEYKNLAEQYLRMNYRAPKPFDAKAEPLKLACSK